MQIPVKQLARWAVEGKSLEVSASSEKLGNMVKAFDKLLFHEG
jgi:hypothetical protein